MSKKGTTTKSSGHVTPPRHKDVEQENTRGQSAPGNAEGDAGKLKQNREQLDVNDEHKTPSMEKGHRGTFP